MRIKVLFSVTRKGQIPCFRWVLISIGLSFSPCCFAQGSGEEISIVIPNSAIGSPGGGGVAPFQADEVRYMSIYDADQILPMLPQGGWITGVAFRLDESVRASQAITIPSVEIWMSTSPSTSTRVSPIFAENAGPDEMLVFNEGPLTFDAPASDSPVVPAPFSTVVRLSRPFFYNPHTGSLEMEIRTFKTGPNPLLDAAAPGAIALGGTLTRPDALAFPLAAPALQLQVVQIPEPATLSLTLLSLLWHFKRGAVHAT